MPKKIESNKSQKDSLEGRTENLVLASIFTVTPTKILEILIGKMKSKEDHMGKTQRGCFFFLVA